MAWFSKTSDKIKKQIEDKEEEIEECKSIRIRINAVGLLMDDVEPDLTAAYKHFFCKYIVFKILISYT